jgi:radical SAM protein with 4Fe4S-binding SPASM domain
MYLNGVGLTGLGETLLYPHLVEFVRYIRSKNEFVGISLSTNAIKPDAPKIVNAIADQIDSLQISIDGCGEVFEKIRRNATWEKYLANLKEIAKIVNGRRAKILLNMVVLEDNYGQMADIIRLAKSLKIPRVYFNTFNLVANNWDTSYYQFYQTDAFKEAIREAVELGNREEVIVGYYNMCSPPGIKNCPFPWGSFYVTWDGFLVPCCAKPFPKEKHFGNVFERGLIDCVNDNEFLKFREMSVKGIIPKFCLRCHIVTSPN